MKRLMIFMLLLFQMLLYIVPVFSKESSIILYQSDGLTITETKAIYRGKVIYDAIDEPKKSGEDAPFLVYHYTPMSLVGSYFSYICDFTDTGSGGGQYTSTFIRAKTVNLKTNQSVSVLDLVDEASLVAALKNDGWVRESVGNLQQLDSCRNFKEIIEVIGLHGIEENFFEEIDPKSFAFDMFDRQTGEVALQLIRNQSLGCVKTYFLN